MQIDLKRKKAIVTASSAGIGLAIAKGLANAGAKVVINGRKKEELEQVKEDITAEYKNADIEMFAGDLSDAEGCKAMINAHPECDILVNNLGVYGGADFFDLDDDEWERYFQTNIMSGVRLSRAYAPAMEGNKWGRIIFISSESGFNIPKDMIHYGFTKAGYIAIARGLAKRLAGTGVTVNSVLPGPTLSDGLKEMLKDDADKDDKPIEEEAKDFVMENRPSSIIQRAATTEEVANMVVYACSQQASATTGASLRVEGGVVDFL